MLSSCPERRCGRFFFSSPRPEHISPLTLSILVKPNGPNLSFGMFTCRHFRRTLLTAICLPIILFGLLIVEQKRDLLVPRFSIQEQSQVEVHRAKRSINEVQQQPIETDYYRREWQELPPVQPVIETKNLERFVHLDLKGAAPRIEYYRKLFPFLKQLGATGLLIEYEDMFPFTGRLAVIRHGLAYSKSDIEELLQLAKNSGFQVMPLLQVYGHLEYVLKLKEFMHLREDRRYPQVITPCLEESYRLLFGR